MKATTKMIAAGVTIFVVGLIVFIVCFALNGWKFDNNYEMKTYTYEKDVGALDIKCDATRIEVVYTDDDFITVEYPETRSFTTTCSVSDGTLCVSNGNRHWYDGLMWFGWNLPTTTIKLPKNTVRDVNFTLNAGTLDLEEAVYGKVDIQINAGTLNMESAVCLEFNCKMNAGTANIETLATREFFMKMNAGSINVGELDCPDIETRLNAGSANIEVKGDERDYTVTVDKNAGSCNISEQIGDTNKKIKVHLNAGSVNFVFEN